MKKHMHLYNKRKKAVKEIVCEDCIVRTNCGEYCEDMDYLIIMCADARNQASSIYEAAIVAAAREVKEKKFQDV